MRFRPILALALVVAACSGVSMQEFNGSSYQYVLDTRPEISYSVVSVPDIQTRMDADLRDAEQTYSLSGLPSDLGRWDKPVIYSNGCHTSWYSASVRVCYDGSDRGPLVVSAGDSHAAHLQPMMARWAKERGWRYASITKAGCPAVKVDPILAEESKLHLGLPYPSCSTWQKELIKSLKKLQPDVVILPLLSRRGLYGSKGLAPWREGVSYTASAIAAFSKVVVLGDDPKVGFDVPSCLSAKQDPSKCAKNRAHSVLRERLEAERLAAEHAGAEWFDISDWFCTRDSCPVAVAGMVVRRDDNHLTRTFSEYLWPRMDQIPTLSDVK